jgi:hypothetical protein
VKYVIEGDKIIKQLNVDVDKRVSDTADNFSFGGIDVCKWFAALGPIGAAFGGFKFARRAATPISASMYMFCDSVLNGKLYV